jgi:hypothetical protein
MKITTVKDVVEASNKILESLVSLRKLVIFNLLVDHGEGIVSNCMWTPTAKVAEHQNFMAVEDYTKIMLLLLNHPKIKNLEYDEKEQAITALFLAPEMQEVDRINAEEF